MTRLLWSLLIFVSLIHAQAPSKRAEVDKLFAAFNTHTPGCAVGLAHQGSVVLQAGYGMADLERNVAITPSTVFESGSVAKQFTAAALMLLAQQGKISLDDPMRKYLPELPDYGAALTIRHVISHLSGLREWRAVATFGGVPEGTFVYSNKDLLQLASQQRGLNFDPGTNYSYTNTGFNVATILVERALANGKTFEEYTRENIFGPLAMTHSQWRSNFRKVIPNRALAYGRVGDALEQMTPIENIIGAGGMLTTVADLLKWNENFTHAKVGGPDFVKAQQTPAKLASGRTITYAAGLTVSTMDGMRVISHGGATGGYRTWLARYPDAQVSVAVLCNSAHADPTTLGHETAKLWTGAAASPAPTSYAADPAKLPSRAGLYRKLRDNTVMHLRFRDGKLYSGEAEWMAVAADSFTMRRGGTEVHFDGPNRFRIVTPDTEMVYERVEPAKPTTAELAALGGDYESRETGSTLRVTAASTDGELNLRIASNAPIRLKPTFRDAFTTPSGSSIFFVRDSSANVVALSAGEDRVWDLRFNRVR